MALRFGKFPRLVSGENDAGKPIEVDGKVVGYIVREVAWRDVGTVRARYAGTVTGYRVELWSTETETTYPTLGAAQDAVRAHYNSTDA